MTDTNAEAKQQEEAEDRFAEARASLERMQKEIAPFVRRRRTTKFSTSGEWRETSTGYSIPVAATGRVLGSHGRLALAW